MGNGWTPERRARQAELIRTWRPWERSTGPRTPEGKVRTARNGFKGGGWQIERDLLRELKAALARQREGLSAVGGQGREGAGARAGSVAIDRVTFRVTRSPRKAQT